jgi:hypothetical protein
MLVVLNSILDLPMLRILYHLPVGLDDTFDD